MNNVCSSLLPNGLKDLLPPEAEKEAHIINLLMQEFSQFGYDRVKPPLVEFEESLLAPGPGQALARNTFRLMDPVSQRMMGVRADTTAQIARIAKSRMSDDVRPVRLCYAADVLRVNGSQLRPERQFTQVGCELIGGDSHRDDVETCLVAISSLRKLDIQNLSIDLSIPVLVNELFDHFNMGDDDREVLNKLLQKRDRDALVDIKSEIADYFVCFLDASGVAADAIQKLKKIEAPQEVQFSILKLIEVYQELVEALEVYKLDDVSITIDLVERRGFDYKSGVSFTLFSTDARGELGRGGRYCLCDNENAVGFSFYMDSVLQAASSQQEEKKKSVSSDASWDEIKDLQDAGYKVSRIQK